MAKQTTENINALALTEEPEVLEGEVEDSLLLKFKKPYKFEDETYTEINLAGLETLTAADMIWAEKFVKRGSGTSIDIMPELSLEYAAAICCRATDQPVEFFKGLPAKEATRLKNIVMGFIFGQE